MKLGEQNWKDASGMADKIVIVPTGAHEQHGHHLPLLTDAMIGEEIIKRAEKELEQSALILPMLWLGHSPHHLQFPGTVSVSASTYIHIIEDITDSLIQGGFRRILFFNSHAGNMTPTSVALGNLQIKYAQTHPDAWLLSTSWFSLAADAIKASGKFKQSKISHACEWETSQILAAHPELVKNERPAVHSLMEINGAPSRFFTADYSKADSVGVARTIDQCSTTGAFGWPNDASVEKGNLLFDLAAQELISLVNEFVQWPEHFIPKAS
ncbi:MAG: creatininase family protein [Abditibacteriaceae bacterium]